MYALLSRGGGRAGQLARQAPRARGGRHGGYGGWNTPLLRRGFHTSAPLKAPVKLWDGVAPAITRPNWQQSERDMEALMPMAKPQQVFQRGVQPQTKKGTPTRRRIKNSTAPDLWEPGPGPGGSGGTSTDVKNYSLKSAGHIATLVHQIARQAAKRQAHLPPNSTQKVVIDARGQGIAAHHLDKIEALVHKATGGLIQAQHVTVYH